jgi:hypothetical protein
MKILDSKGRELKVGDQERRRGRARVRGHQADHVIVRILEPYGGTVSIGHWHGHPREYRPSFCIPWATAEQTGAPNTYRCPDLERIDSEGASVNG